MDIWRGLFERINESEKDLLQSFESSLTKSLIAELSSRQDAFEKRLEERQINLVGSVERIQSCLEALLQKSNELLQKHTQTSETVAGKLDKVDKLEDVLYELRVLSFRLNAVSEPRSPEGLFRALQEESLRDTLTIIKREMPQAMHVLEHRSFLRHAVSKAGDGVILEFGVYSGMTINWMAEDFPTRKFYGFDSFEGLPEAWSGHELFDFNRDGTPPDVLSNVELVKGLFSQTLPAFSASLEEEIAVLHVDCDIYSSTKNIFDVLGSRLKDGCIIIFDEYFDYPGFENHERKAFAEFLQHENCSIEWLAFCGQRAAGRLRRTTS